jgi:hypothetical protein
VSDFRSLLAEDGSPLVPPQKRRDTTGEATEQFSLEDIRALQERLDATERRVEAVAKARRTPAAPVLPWSLAAVRIAIVTGAVVITVVVLWLAAVLVQHYV